LIAVPWKKSVTGGVAPLVVKAARRARLASKGRVLGVPPCWGIVWYQWHLLGPVIVSYVAGTREGGSELGSTTHPNTSKGAEK
jgi:hypothetical protein